ncbi:hypothetical protein PO909_025970 [Leuciscus waleckii]
MQMSLNRLQEAEIPEELERLRQERLLRLWRKAGYFPTVNSACFTGIETCGEIQSLPWKPILPEEDGDGEFTRHPSAKRGKLRPDISPTGPPATRMPASVLSNANHTSNPTMLLL